MLANVLCFCTSKSQNYFITSLLIFFFLLIITGCDSSQTDSRNKSESIGFAFIADMPYNARQRKQYLNLMKEIDADDLAFVVHGGDFAFDGIAWKESSKGLPPCADETFKDRLALAQNSRHPFIFTPGDNDWSDCHRAKPKSYDPIERLTVLRKMFFQGERSLGQRSLELVRQSTEVQFKKFRENVRWTAGNVLFVTLHMVGGNNNLGRTKEMDEEYAERNDANIAWMNESFEQASLNKNRAIMIFSQANPRFETSWTARKQKRYILDGLAIKPPKERRETGFDDFILELEELTVEFGKPVVYAHGDTHTYRIDKPLISSTSRRFIENFTRVETFGYPDTHWIKVIIDADDPNVFRFKQKIVEENKVMH